MIGLVRVVQGAAVALMSIALVACSHGATKTPALTSTGGSQDTLVPATGLIDLFLDVEDVHAITGQDMGKAPSIETAPEDHGPADAKNPCQTVLQGTADVDVFGHDYIGYRDVLTSSTFGPRVMQTIALYPAVDGAAAAYQKIATALTNCQNSGGAGGFVKPGTAKPSQTSWTYPASTVQGPTSDQICGVAARQNRNVMFIVRSCRVGNDADVAEKVSDTIDSRIDKTH